MAIRKLIAAIEISSTRLIGIAGSKQEDNTLKILALTDTSATSFMHKGMVFNIDKAKLAIKSIIEQLENQLDSKISKVYLGINSLSTHSVSTTLSKYFTEKTHITADILAQLKAENKKNIENKYGLAILESIPQEYEVENLERTSPIGVRTSAPLKARFVNILCRKSVVDNLNLCFEKEEFKISDIKLSHLLSANVLLTEQQRNRGCAFINFGAETTALSIYKKNILRYHVVIPLGGQSLTRDLTKLQVDQDRAEIIKQAYGDVDYHEQDRNNPNTIFAETGKDKEIPLFEINACLKARQEEILVNIKEQIKHSNYKDELSDGIIIFGEAAKIKNLKKLIAKIFDTDKIEEATPSFPKIEYSEIFKNFFDPAQIHKITTPLALIMTGEENCTFIKDGDQPYNLFGEDELMEKQKEDEDRIKEKSEKIQQEAEEKARKLEEEKEAEIQKIIQQEKEEELERKRKEAEKEEIKRRKQEKKDNSAIQKIAKWFGKTVNGLSQTTFSDDDDENN